jgi:hypothetical protein
MVPGSHSRPGLKLRSRSPRLEFDEAAWFRRNAPCSAARMGRSVARGP